MSSMERSRGDIDSVQVLREPGRSAGAQCLKLPREVSATAGHRAIVPGGWQLSARRSVSAEGGEWWGLEGGRAFEEGRATPAG